VSLRTEVLTPKDLSPADRGALVDALYAVHGKIFDGVRRETFVRYVVESSADRTWVQVVRDDAGEIVGYFAAHAFLRTLRGRPSVVFRGETGMLRAHRGTSVGAPFAARMAASFLAENPGLDPYYLGCLVHPSSYTMVCKYADRLWPAANAPLPDEERDFMCALGDEFGLAVVDPSRPLVRDVGWRTRDTEAERRYWERCDRPPARFYLAQNPGYVEGHGLLTLVPFSVAILTRAAARIARVQLQARATRLTDAARALPGVQALLRPGEVRQSLRAVELFRALDDAQIRALAERAETVTLAPGRVLFREGDRGDDLYVIARGAVFVTVGPDDDETVLDELSAGAVLGEIAMLTGTPRTATVRAASRSVLVRLPRAAAQAVMDAHPDIGDAVWRALAARRFEDLAASSPRYAALSRDARAAWIAAGTWLTPAAGEALPPGAVLVLEGDVEVNRGDGAMLLRGPCHLALDGDDRAVARSRVRALRMPDALRTARDS
jgi:CRP-like cAMP-binding protein